MARPAAMTAGKTNRKFIIIALVLGLLGATLVYITMTRNSGSGSGAGPSTSAVVVAKQDIPARTKITAGMVEVKLVPEDAKSLLSYNDPALVVGQVVTRFPITANEQIISSKVIPLTTTSPVSRSLSFTVPQGKRGFAINVDGVTNAGGLLLPGDYVDIVVIYDLEFAPNPADPTNRETVENYFVNTLFQNIEILAVSQTVVDVVPEATPTANGQRVRNTEASPQPDAVTVTMALTPEEAQLLYLAEGNGRIRLSVRPYGDAEQRPVDFRVENDLFPANIPNPFQRR